MERARIMRKNKYYNFILLKIYKRIFSSIPSRIHLNRSQLQLQWSLQLFSRLGWIQKSTKHWIRIRHSAEKAKIRIFLLLVKTKRKTSKSCFFLCDRPFIYRKKIIQNMYTHIVSINVNWKLPVLVNLSLQRRNYILARLARFLVQAYQEWMIRLNTSIALSVWGCVVPTFKFIRSGELRGWLYSW